MSRAKFKTSSQRTRNAVKSLYEDESPELRLVVSKPMKSPIVPKSKNQEYYIEAIQNQKIIFGVGPAGTGKSYIATCMAADALRSGEIEKVIITRPAVEAGESLGFLPGELEEKYEPYIAPIRDILEKRLGKSTLEYMIKHGLIEAAPMAYLRGKTFDNCIVLLDEAQNCTPNQMKLFLTRIGENCTMIIDGDPSQKDINTVSGLEDAIRKIAWIPQVSVIEFTVSDIVRSGICQEIVESYEKK